MTTNQLPSSMRIWQYTSTKGGLENNLKLNLSAALPIPKPDQHLIKVFATTINPVDYKPAESPAGRFLVPKPACPCVDVAGVIVKPAPGSALKVGQRVFGASAKSPFAGAALAEYAAVPVECVMPLPDGVSAIDASGLPVAALTAYQSILPRIKAGSRVFLNGGSGGTGTYGIQLAKAAGAHVTVSCSGANAALCRELGADDVLDYREAPVVKQLQARAQAVRPFDLVVDNVFADPTLYWYSHTYSTATSPYVNVAGAASLSYAITVFKIRWLPAFLGGGRRKFVTMFTELKQDQGTELAAKMAEGKLKTVIDEIFPFDKAVEAFRRSKSGRSRGKIVIEVAKEE